MTSQLSNIWMRKDACQENMSYEEMQVDSYYRELRSLLNKLTPQKFTILLESLLSLNIDTEFKMKALADFVIQKAINEQLYSRVYAKLCATLCRKMNAGSFKMHLLRRCQDTFQDIFLCQDLRCEDDSNKVKDLKEMAKRRRLFSCVVFIGNLHRVKLIHEGIIHESLKRLLQKSSSDTFELQLECFCKLLQTVGRNLDGDASKQSKNDCYFTIVEELVEQRELCSRVRFALLDLLELRKNYWMCRRKQEMPTTIDAIRSPSGG